MKIPDTVNLWRNAIGILGNPAKASQHPLARRVIKAVGAEWVRRRRKPVDSTDAFSWPSTKADYGSGDLDTTDWMKEGVLKFMGYKVGNIDGEPSGIRERILAQIFLGPLPPVFPDLYLDEWGAPSSAMRHQKMAETIAALTRNAKRRHDSRMPAAVRDWEKDLEYLYFEYYVSKFNFGWPTIATQ